LGCIATGPTTEDALAATPDAIDAYRGFPRRIGEHDWEHLAELSRRPGGPEV